MSENKTAVETVVHIGEEMLADAGQGSGPILAKVGTELIGLLIGLAIDEVKKLCASKGVEVRVASEDGKTLELSQDMRDDRVNIHVENGVVKNATVG